MPKVNGICGREIEFVPGKLLALSRSLSLSLAHTHELSLLRRAGATPAALAISSSCSSSFSSLPDFDILSHYVDNLDVCLAHSLAGFNLAKMQPAKICTFSPCSQRGLEGKSYNFSDSGSVSFIRDLNVCGASFAIYQIKIVTQKLSQQERGRGSKRGWFSTLPFWGDSNVTVAGSAKPN